MIDEIKKKQELKLSKMLNESKKKITEQYEESRQQIENAKIESIKLISSKFLNELPSDAEIRKEIN